MNAPRTSREALIAEMLGDLDALLLRIESLPATVTDAEQRLVTTAASLNAAGDRYRMAVTAFNEQAKADLSEYLDRKSSQVAVAATKTMAEQRAAIQEVTRTALQSMEFRRSWRDRFTEHLVTALLASTLAAGFMTYLLQRN